MKKVKMTRSKGCLLFLGMFLLFGFGCESRLSMENSNMEEKHEMDSTIYAISHVNVLQMTSGNEIIEDATILIYDHKILAINEAIPDGAVIIEGKGKWLIPGLIDMHIHGFADINFGNSYPTKGPNFFANNQDVMTLYLANGVSTILDLNARVENFGQRNEIIEGKIIGPRIALAALINGGDGEGRIANTPADGRQSVRMAKAEGYDFIKVYSQLNRETYFAIVDEADKQGMKVVGHIPNAFRRKLAEAFVPNFALVAHAEEFAKQAETGSDEEIRLFAKLAKDNGIWLSPTLIAIERFAQQSRTIDSIPILSGFPFIHPLMQNKWLTSNQYHRGTSPERVQHLEKMIEFNRRLVRAFKEAGVPILAGTDAGCSGVIWGYALHDELRLLVEAGLSPTEALESATRLSATWLGIEDKIGTIEVGKFADLVLLDANPLDDIRNTQKISGVFMNGRWVDKLTIDNMLSDLAKRNEEDMHKFEWKNRKNF